MFTKPLWIQISIWNFNLVSVQLTPAKYTPAWESESCAWFICKWPFGTPLFSSLFLWLRQIQFVIRPFSNDSKERALCVNYHVCAVRDDILPSRFISANRPDRCICHPAGLSHEIAIVAVTRYVSHRFVLIARMTVWTVPCTSKRMYDSKTSSIGATSRKINMENDFNLPWTSPLAYVLRPTCVAVSPHVHDVARAWVQSSPTLPASLFRFALR